MFVISFFAFVKQMQAGCYEMYHFASHKPVSFYRACSTASKWNCRPVKTRLLDNSRSRLRSRTVLLYMIQTFIGHDLSSLFGFPNNCYFFVVSLRFQTLAVASLYGVEWQFT
jgi:hypothetical protein